MNKKNSMAGIVLMTLLLILSGCGERGELGGTGVEIRSVSIVGDEPAGGDNEIDAAVHMCPPDFAEIEKGLFIANAQLTIDAAAIGFDPFPAMIDECTVTYFKGEENPDAPIIESIILRPQCTLVEDEANECNLPMMDIAQKEKWWNDATAINFPSTYPTHYIVRFDCTYTNKWSRDNFPNPILYDIWLADWNYC